MILHILFSFHKILCYNFTVIIKIKNKKEDFMTNKQAIESLKKIKTYTAAGLLDVIEYLIKVLEKLDKEGVTDPLNTDFTKLKN